MRLELPGGLVGEDCREVRPALILISSRIFSFLFDIYLEQYPFRAGVRSFENFVMGNWLLQQGVYSILFFYVHFGNDRSSAYQLEVSLSENYT